MMVLSGGDYLIWRSDYQDNCVETARRNTAAGHPNRSVDMLTITRPYTPLNQQVVCDPGMYALIAMAALRTWKASPNKAAGMSYLRCCKGQSEPYSDSVNRLSQLAGRTVPDVDATMPVIKLAYERMPTSIVRRPFVLTGNEEG